MQRIWFLIGLDLKVGNGFWDWVLYITAMLEAFLVYDQACQTGLIFFYRSEFIKI